MLINFLNFQEVKKKILEKFEIEAFLAQAVSVSKLTNEDILRFPDPTDSCDPRAVHLSTLFQRTCHEIDTVSAACGHPVSAWEVSIQGVSKKDANLPARYIFGPPCGLLSPKPVAY